jgi:hypothetical protein
MPGGRPTAERFPDDGIELPGALCEGMGSKGASLPGLPDLSTLLRMIQQPLCLLNAFIGVGEGDDLPIRLEKA